MAAGAVFAQGARDNINIVGSSTVYPFTTVVAEQFGRTTPFKTPKVESTGTGGGFKLFCGGVGVRHPDIANASRAIKDSEVGQCRENGIEGIVEVKIGYDGIVIARSNEAQQLDLSLKDVYLALAKDVPAPDGGEKLVRNPYKTWKDVNPDLPDTEIEVLGPPPTSGTRDAFVELAMEGGCSAFDWIAALKDSDGDRYEAVCHTLREDGAFVEAGENDNLIVQKLESNNDALGVFGFSFLDQNTDVLEGSMIDGVEPAFEAIASGEYAVSRPLFIYVKKAHVGRVPGMEEFLAEFTSERAWGEDGYLADKGLIPLPDAEREEMQARVESLTEMKVAQQ
ncbi:MAG: PstS family phosphate ABC transporter substrate-binding protein [Gammaproteobacteria bacterium]|nr:PstS family phosphate ABC transporter substrate-binding protein [Gammaproteobacteria bacterium]